MKLYISADIEGTCGIVCWDETEYGTPRYEYFSRQMSREVAAACEGLIDAGAEDILVRDAHDSARNIHPDMHAQRYSRENIETALKLGADIIEIDIRLADGKPYCQEDPAAFLLHALRP